MHGIWVAVNSKGGAGEKFAVGVANGIQFWLPWKGIACLYCRWDPVTA